MSEVKVGDKFVIERRSTNQIDHRRVATVTRVTPKRAYLGDEWFALDDPQRVVKPRYYDFWTTATPVKAKSGGAP